MDGAEDISMGAAVLKPGTPLDPAALLGELKGLKGEAKLLQMFDARAVAGRRHILSAFLHAKRAARGSPRIRLRDLGAIMALYMAGTDQIGRALECVGIHGDTTRFVIVRSPAGDLKDITSRLGLEFKMEAFPTSPTAATMERLGMDRGAYQDLEPKDWELAVLEHVAMIDLPG